MKLTCKDVEVTLEQHVEFMKGLAAETPLHNGLFKIAEIREGRRMGFTVRVITFEDPITLIGAPMPAQSVQQVALQLPEKGRRKTPLGDLVACEIAVEPFLECRGVPFDFARMSDFIDGAIFGQKEYGKLLPISHVETFRIGDRLNNWIVLSDPLYEIIDGLRLRAIEQIRVILDAEGRMFDGKYSFSFFRPLDPFDFYREVPMLVTSERMVGDDLVLLPDWMHDEIASEYAVPNPAIENEELATLIRRDDDDVSHVIADFLEGHYRMPLE